MLGRGSQRAGHQVCRAALRQPTPLCVAESWGFDIEAMSWLLWFTWALGRSGWCYSAAVKDLRDMWTTELPWAPHHQGEAGGRVCPWQAGDSEGGALDWGWGAVWSCASPALLSGLTQSLPPGSGLL